MFKRKENILIITENYKTGGLESHIDTYARFFRTLGHRVFIISSGGGDLLAKTPYAKIEILPKLGEFTGQGINCCASRIEEFIKEEKISLALIHPFISFITGSIAAKNAAIPYKLILHGPGSVCNIYSPQFRTAVKLLSVPHASEIVVVSAEVAKVFAAEYPGYEAVLIPNPINGDTFQKQIWKKNGNVAICSRLDDDKKKSVTNAIDFYSKYILPKNPGRQLLIFGDGNEKNSIEGYCRNTEARDFAKFCGYVNNSELNNYLRDSSLIFGMGRVALESLVMNIPIVLSGYDGLKGVIKKTNLNEFADSNFSGRGSENMTDQELANEIDEIADNIEHYNLRDYILGLYSINTLGKRMISIQRKKCQINAYRVTPSMDF